MNINIMDLPPEVATRLVADRDLVRALRRHISQRIERDIAILDALTPDPDLEDGGDDEPSLCGIIVTCPHQGGDDREDGDDNGIADSGGLCEQHQRAKRIARAMALARASRPGPATLRLIQGGQA